MAYLADNTGLDLRLKFAESVVIADQMADHQLPVGPCCGGRHAVGFEERQGERFLDIGM